jgi:hypothetical protein
VAWTGKTTTHGYCVRRRRLRAIGNGDGEVTYEHRNRNEHDYIKYLNNSYGTYEVYLVSYSLTTSHPDVQRHASFHH